MALLQKAASEGVDMYVADVGSGQGGNGERLQQCSRACIPGRAVNGMADRVMLHPLVLLQV